MCNLKTCCCCCSLRTGSIFFAIFTLTLGVLGLIPWAGAAIKYADQRVDGDDSKVTAEEITAYVQCALYALWVITAIILLCGICMRTRGCLIPWTIITIIMIVIAIWGIVIAIIAIVDKSGEASWEEYFALILSITVCVVNIYAVMIVCSYHKRHMQEAVV